jgi:dCMP deaminase
MRITREQMWMEIAHIVAKRGTCTRMHVGAVITDASKTRALSVGYNGNAAHLPNICDRVDEGNCGCLHAEMNALLKAPSGPPLILFTTYAPCEACAKAIINAGVTHVYYASFYRTSHGLAILGRAGIGCERLLSQSTLPAAEPLG